MLNEPIRFEDIVIFKEDEFALLKFIGFNSTI